ncbi:MAG: hypothetical protein AB8B51_03565 [Sedimentitalea sp.]
MLNIYAHSFMTATRSNCVQLRDHPKTSAAPKYRWLPSGHWWLKPTRCVDLDRL